MNKNVLCENSRYSKNKVCSLVSEIFALKIYLFYVFLFHFVIYLNGSIVDLVPYVSIR